MKKEKINLDSLLERMDAYEATLQEEELKARQKGSLKKADLLYSLQNGITDIFDDCRSLIEAFSEKNLKG